MNDEWRMSNAEWRIGDTAGRPRGECFSRSGPFSSWFRLICFASLSLWLQLAISNEAEPQNAAMLIRASFDAKKEERHAAASVALVRILFALMVVRIASRDQFAFSAD